MLRDELRRFLEENGMSQRQFAAFIGVAPQSLNRWLSNESGLSVGDRVDEALYGYRRSELERLLWSSRLRGIPDWGE